MKENNAYQPKAIPGWWNFLSGAFKYPANRNLEELNQKLKEFNATYVPIDGVTFASERDLMLFILRWA